CFVDNSKFVFIGVHSWLLGISEIEQQLESTVLAEAERGKPAPIQCQDSVGDGLLRSPDQSGIREIHGYIGIFTHKANGGSECFRTKNIAHFSRARVQERSKTSRSVLHICKEVKCFGYDCTSGDKARTA